MTRVKLGKHGDQHRPKGTLGPDDLGGEDPILLPPSSGFSYAAATQFGISVPSGSITALPVDSEDFYTNDPATFTLDTWTTDPSDPEYGLTGVGIHAVGLYLLQVGATLVAEEGAVLIPSAYECLGGDVGNYDDTGVFFGSFGALGYDANPAGTVQGEWDLTNWQVIIVESGETGTSPVMYEVDTQPTGAPLTGAGSILLIKLDTDTFGFGIEALLRATALKKPHPRARRAGLGWRMPVLRTET